MKRIQQYLLLCLIPWMASAQEPFYCSMDAYLFQYNDVYGINLASGQSTLIAEDIVEGTVNAAAYNPVDGYIWGSLSTPEQAIVRIGKDVSLDIHVIDDFFTANPYVGAINANGQYYMKPSGAAYKVVDLDPASSTYLEVVVDGTLSISLGIADWAFNAADNMLYTVTIGGDNRLFRIDPSTGAVTELGPVPILNGLNYTYGAVYFDVSGNFYVSANQSGTIYIIKEVQNILPAGAMDSNLFAYGPASASNDGARCPTAPVPQEICDNGIDDDDDGLIDCEDPSCSGVDLCPLAQSSGGNNGGLESNNRLSELIARRNYDRAIHPVPPTKGGPLANYSTQNAIPLRSQTLTLQELIPVGVLGETEALESTPDDLVHITNASQVYSVDYLDEGRNIATVLGLETEGRVYEHSKFICDRLSGAELNSVSKIYIREQPFVKSIIYRPDGRREFVVSFAIRLTDTGSVIESHWNLDSYPESDTYYNFQIWTASIDDLLMLTEEILALVDAKAPIEEYVLSDEPHVYVQKAYYESGQLHLQIMNNDFSSSLLIQGGARDTETASFSTLSMEEDITPYRNDLTVEMGQIFDAGLRLITDKDGTPDDLFVSDGPWGYDDAAASTTVTEYEVLPSQDDHAEDMHVVSRGVHLTAVTSDYVSIYRALTPRFVGVDLDDEDYMTFQYEGQGILDVTLLKEGVHHWEEQLHTQVLLTEGMNTYRLERDQFADLQGLTSDWSDIKTIVFTQRSETGTAQEISMHVTELAFGSGGTVTSTEDISSSTTLHPNPAADHVTVMMGGDMVVQVEAVDLMGRHLAVPWQQGEALEIDIKHLDIGLYTLSIRTMDDQVIQEKLTIQR